MKIILKTTEKNNDVHEVHCWGFKCCQKDPMSSPGALQKPLGRTMGLQDSHMTSPRYHQESLRGLQEPSKSSPEAAKSAPKGCQDNSKTLQEASKRLFGPLKRPARDDV